MGRLCGECGPGSTRSRAIHAGRPPARSDPTVQGQSNRSVIGIESTTSGLLHFPSEAKRNPMHGWGRQSCRPAGLARAAGWRGADGSGLCRAPRSNRADRLSAPHFPRRANGLVDCRCANTGSNATELGRAQAGSTVLHRRPALARGAPRPGASPLSAAALLQRPRSPPGRDADARRHTVPFSACRRRW